MGVCVVLNVREVTEGGGSAKQNELTISGAINPCRAHTSWDMLKLLGL